MNCERNVSFEKIEAGEVLRPYGGLYLVTAECSLFGIRTRAFPVSSPDRKGEQLRPKRLYPQRVRTRLHSHQPVLPPPDRRISVALDPDFIKVPFDPWECIPFLGTRLLSEAGGTPISANEVRWHIEDLERRLRGEGLVPPE